IFDKVGDIGLPTCIVGGPIEGGWGPVPDYGRPRFVVTDTEAGHVTVTYTDGPLAAGAGEGDGFLGIEGVKAFLTVNSLAKPFFVKSSDYSAIVGGDGAVQGYFPGLVARVYNASTGAVVGDFTPIAAAPQASF